MTLIVGREGNPLTVAVLERAQTLFEGLTGSQINFMIALSDESAWYGPDAMPDRLRTRVRPFDSLNEWGYECVYRRENRSLRKVEAGFLFGEKKSCIKMLETAKGLGILPIVNSLLSNQLLFDESAGWSLTSIKEPANRWFIFVIETMKKNTVNAMMQVEKNNSYQIFEIANFVDQCLTSINNAIFMMEKGMELWAEIKWMKVPIHIGFQVETSTPKPNNQLSKNDVEILNALTNSGILQNQYDIETSTRISRKTISKHLKKLMTFGYVHQPKGARSGYGITSEGKKAISAR